MAGQSETMLRELLQSLHGQTYQDYEVIVSDDSAGMELQAVCGEFESVKYYRNPGPKGACSNLNNAIRHAKFAIIKPMFQDDRFLDPGVLQAVAACSSSWSVCTSAHTSDRADHVPYAADDIYELARGRNSFGSPSAIAWKRNSLEFDTNLQWLFDCDFYARMCMEYGQPAFLPERVLIREWDGMCTRTSAVGAIRTQDLEYIENKFSNLRS